MDQRRLTIALVGEVRGEIQPCGCPTLPLGGFERRSALLDELAQESDPLFHLDAGELLIKGFATGGRGSAAQRARLLLELSSLVDVDAWSPGPGDLAALQPDSWLHTITQIGPPATSSTWIGQNDKPWLPPLLVLRKQGITIGVIGVSARPGETRWKKHITMMDPVQAAQMAVDSISEDLDLLVALSNLPDVEADRLAREVPDLAVILSTANDSNDEPRYRDGGLVVEVPGRGRYATVLRILLGSDSGRTLFLTDDLATRDRLDEQIQTMTEHTEAGLAQSQLMDAQKRLERLEQTIHEQASGRNLAYVNLVPLGTRFTRPQDEIASRIEEYKLRVLHQTENELEQDQSRTNPPTEYVSSAACFNCHSEQFARWTLTSHARAMEVLYERGAEKDPECLTCHTTGFGLPGGWADLNSSNLRKFKAVQCEACHGPLAGHPEDTSVIPTPIQPSTCLRCHDKPNSPDFNYASYLPQASCIALESSTIQDP